MTQDMRLELGRMLDRYDEVRRDTAARKLQVEADQASFLKGFADLRREVLRPVFESAGAILRERGHGYRITEEEFAVDAGGKAAEARISLRVDPAGMEALASGDDHLRSFSFTTRHYNKTVWMSFGAAMNAGGSLGSKGAYQLAQLNRELVQGELLKFIAGVVQG
jgi:hypothetical protein